MNAKDYLEDMRSIFVDLERMALRLQRCEDQLNIHAAILDSCGKTQYNDQLPDTIAELIKYRDEILEEQRIYIQKDRETDYVLEHVRDPRERRVLSLRFCNNLTFREIAERIGYTLDGTKKLCQRAIDNLDRNLIEILQDYRHNS